MDVTQQVSEVDATLLGAAVQSAIEQSSTLVEHLQQFVDAALNRVDDLCAKARSENVSTSTKDDVLHAFEEIFIETRNVAEELFARQRQTLEQVRFTLFGRTGAGKSSLIEALTHGDGSTVSTGESDFTVAVRSVAWNACLFSDTPGINGWGRTVSRSDLERRARREVETADLVLLCFDTQNQQRDEFQKIAAWVLEFGKPVIAVLNVRNPIWRRPSEVQLGSQRRRVQQAVREHAGNIEAELAALGLTRAPVVAISAQKGVIARATEPYLGPAKDQFKKLRESVGREALLRASNVAALERILIEALMQDAAALRLGMLCSQADALLSRLQDAIQTVRQDAEKIARALDQTIEGFLGVVGYPSSNTPERSALPTSPTGEDLLTSAERARGGSYQASAQGRLQRFARQRLEAETGALRARSLASAEELVTQAFERRRDLDSKEFSASVFRNADIEAAGGKVVRDVESFVRRETNIVIESAQLDLKAELGGGSKLFGSTGSTKKAGGNALRLAGIAAIGIAAIAFPPSLLVGLIAGLATWTLSWVGERLTKDAERERQRAWSEALASVRRTVHDAYDGFQAQVADECGKRTRHAIVELLRDPLARVATLWTMIEEMGDTADTLARLRAELPNYGDPQTALERAVSKVQRATGPGSLLGDDWLGDPEGLVADEGHAEPRATSANQPTLGERLFGSLKGLAARFQDSVRPGSGKAWLMKTQMALQDDIDARPALGELQQILNRNRPRLLVLGDYSSGKSSLVKRLLIDAGIPIPDSIKVRADPTTDETHIYEWESWDLVDVPGFQSSKDSHTARALAAYPDASAILYLLGPNLLVGDTAALRQILKGERQTGLAPKFDRTLFVVNRCDELGLEPELAPDEYVRLCDRKRSELREALASIGVDVVPERMVCIAADPFGLVGDRLDVDASQLDRFRSWDGIRPLHHALREIWSELAASAVDRSLLEGGLARLGRLDAATFERRADLEDRMTALSRLAATLEGTIAEAERIEDEQAARARRMIDDHAFAALERVAQAANEAELVATVERLKTWWEQEEFQGDAERWQNEAKSVIDEWFQRAADLLERTIDAPHFKAAVARSGRDFDPSGIAGPKRSWLWMLADVVARPLKGANREAVYAAGKFLGVKFRPWGAVKAARLFGRVGAALGVAAAVLEAVNIDRSWKGEESRRKKRQQMAQFMKKSADEVYRRLTIGEDEASAVDPEVSIAGPLRYLRVLRDKLLEVSAQLEVDHQTLQVELSRIEGQSTKYRARMNEALTALGFEEVTP